MRTALFAVLVGLAGLGAGCAQGSDADDGDLGSVPVVALSNPGYVGNAASSPAERARATSGHDFGGATLGALAYVGCKKNAFCDDFEDADPGSRWTSAHAAAGTVDFIGPSSSLGANALRTITTGAGSAAYLTLAGDAVGKQWVGALSFSFRLEAAPTTLVGGPEIAVVGANGATTRIGFSVRPEGIALHQRFDACAGPSCTTRSDLVAPVKPGEWRRLAVAVETSATLAPPYGRIEVSVDGGQLITLPLSVTPFDGRAEVHAGITVADDAPATVRVDDVVFFTKQ